MKMVKHYSGGESEQNLVCTKPPHPATESHKDAICCWAFHEFEGADPEPYDVWHGKNCSCGTYGCETRALLDKWSPASSDETRELLRQAMRDAGEGEVFSDRMAGILARALGGV